MLKVFLAIVLPMILLVPAQAQFAITNFQGGERAYSGINRGFRFRVEGNRFVSALGMYDVDLNGLPSDDNLQGVDVSIWSDSGDLLAWAIVAGQENADIIDGFRMAYLDSPLELEDGQFYRVVADMADLQVSAKYLHEVPRFETHGISEVQSISGNGTFENRAPSFPNRLGPIDTAAIGPNLFFGTIAEPSILGDCNLDEVVDFSDIPAFIAVQQSGVFLSEADCDLSGVVDFSDISAFIDILIGQ